jgi:hypothetical protein
MSSEQSVPPTPRMCTGKNCNFYGNPLTGKCSKCYREEQAARAAAASANGAPAGGPPPVIPSAASTAPMVTSSSLPKTLPTTTAPMAIPGARPAPLDDPTFASLPNGGGTALTSRCARAPRGHADTVCGTVGRAQCLGRSRRRRRAT